MTETGGSKLTNIIKAKEDMNKSPEQLENEKREIIASRLVRLRLDGQTKDNLQRQAKNFNEILVDLYDIIYDLNEKHERQKYDMMELTKRAIQIEKGKSKTRKSNIVHTGLGGSVFPWLTDTSVNAPGKISLFSRYERVTDRRSFANRRDLWESHKDEDDKKHLNKIVPNIDSKTKLKREAFEHKEEHKEVERKPVEKHIPKHVEVKKAAKVEESHHEEEEEEEHHRQEEQHHEEEDHHEDEHHDEEEDETQPKEHYEESYEEDHYSKHQHDEEEED